MTDARWIAAVITAALAAPAPASAEYLSGARLVQLCAVEAATQAGQTNRAVCLGYLMGVIDDFGARPVRPQLPPGVTVDQVRTALIGYLPKQPRYGAAPGAALVTATIADTWPTRLGEPKRPPAQ